MATIQKGDKVLVITGKDRGKTGLVERVLVKERRVIVGGINLVKRHQKRSAQNPQGGIIEKNASLDVSNVMLLDPKTDKPSRVGYKMNGQEKVRFAKRSGEAVKKVKAA
ncbi:MAG: 50S ribosomal protein L24 [Patescibacteria group bacterium]